MKCLKNTNEQPSFVGVDYDLVYRYTVNDDAYVKADNYEYEVSDIKLKPDNVVLFPLEDIELSFVGKTYKITDGVRELVSEETIVKYLTMASESDLKGCVYWMGQKVEYEATKEVGVTTVLYVRENATCTGYTEDDIKVDGYEYKLAEINEKIDDSLKTRGWTPVAILGGTAEQINELDPNYKTYEDGGEDLFIALAPIYDKLPIVENGPGANMGFQFCFGVDYSNLQNVVMPDGKTSGVTYALSGSPSSRYFNSSGGNATEWVETTDASGLTASDYHKIRTHLNGKEETLIEVTKHAAIQNGETKLVRKVFTNTPQYDATTRDVEFISALTPTTVILPSYSDILEKDEYTYREVLNINRTNSTASCPSNIVGVSSTSVFFSNSELYVKGVKQPLSETFYYKLAPCAAACYAYNTKGTKKKHWYLPSIGELILINSVNVEGLGTAMEILENDIVKIYDATNTTIPLNYRSEPAHFYRKSDCEEITSGVTYTGDNRNYLVRLYGDPNGHYFSNLSEQKEKEKTARGGSLVGKLFDVRTCEYGFDGYGFTKEGVFWGGSDNFYSVECFIAHTDEWAHEVTSETEKQNVHLFKLKDELVAKREELRMYDVAMLNGISIHTSSIYKKSTSYYPLNVDFTKTKKIDYKSPDTTYPVMKGRFRTVTKD